MHGLIMDYQLTIPAILRRAEQLFGNREIVSRRPDRSIHRYTYAACIKRARKLGAALQSLGVGRGDRVATLCWNHYRHLEAYYGIPSSGAVVHTLNLRLHPDDLAYVATHAGDTAVIVDKVLLNLLEKFRARAPFRHVIVATDDGEVPEGMLDYEKLLSNVQDSEVEIPELDERAAAVMCYTSGTTGKPKGVLYSHRAIALHTLASTLATTLDIRESDTVLPVVPMFHANAWGLPFTCAMVGAKQVCPGPHLDPRSLLELFQSERVTISAGVPTIWLGLLQALDAEPGAYDLSAMRRLIVGGAAVPESMIRGFQERHGLSILQAWGMTEMAPLGTVANLTPEMASESKDAQYAHRAKQGAPAPFVEIRARGENGLVAWDGTSMGELEVRGPWVASAYYEAPDSGDRFTDDGWFKTGDIVSIDAHGFVEIRDRAKDLIKSGGEWISSVALENALMGHPSVAEAAVVAAPHPRWQECPVAVVVLKPGHNASQEDLTAHLADRFPRWWLPHTIERVTEIPRTSAGKVQKSALREKFRGWTATD
ncbi:MAG: long-chain fatty acid--CoA ligase [Gemmatimonadaceae bacterium]